MCNGYLSQITFLLASVTANANSLEGKVVEGEKAEAVLQPLIDKLGTSMSQYQTGIRTIKNVVVSSLQGCA